MSQKGRTFYIEAYNQSNELLNKYKFVFDVKTVKELFSKIREKLQAKQEITKQEKIVLKDENDYELGSDDEVEDVLENGKLKIYIKKSSDQPKIENATTPRAKLETGIDLTSLHVKLPNSQKSISSQNLLGTLVAVDKPVLDLTNWTPPQVPQNYPEEKVWSIICPQIRKSKFQIPVFENATFYEISKYLVKQFNFNENLKAILYTFEGVPLLFNLDLLHLQTPKLNLKKPYYVIFTNTASASADSIPAEPQETLQNCVDIQVTYFGDKKLSLKFGLQNSLSVLKFKIFKEIGIAPLNQIIKFANNALTNDADKLSTYNVKADSILTLEFKTISNVVASTYTDKFFYKDVQMLHPQDQQAYRFFKSHLLTLGIHLSETLKNKFLSFIRFFTSNEPLVNALRTLFTRRALLSQAHRIALEEGFYSVVWHYAKGANPSPRTQSQFLFNHFRHFLGYALETISKATQNDAVFSKKQQTIVLSKNCELTVSPITSPYLIKLDDGSTVVVDQQKMIEQINKGYTYPLLKEAKKEKLFCNESLLQNWDIFVFNLKFSTSPFQTSIWIGAEQKDLIFSLPTINVIEQFQPNVISHCPNLKVFSPLQAKSKTQRYIMLLNKQSEIRIFVGTNKDINCPHLIYDVISGQEQAVNFDLMMAAGKTENLEEVIDFKDMKPVITRTPKQAIVVLFDISGSMASKYFKENDLNRIGACKSFFQALAYRTIAYSLEHVISLVLFDNNIKICCDFTEAIYDFNRLVSSATPTGSTKLYDAIIQAVQNLTKFKTRYPDCILRIMALTDGQDTCSKNTIFDVSKAVINNNIVMDSFAVGPNCVGLKTITKVTGGKCYLTGNFEESMKLFEQETVLSVRSRKYQPLINSQTDIQIKDRINAAETQPFDLCGNVHDFKIPEMKGPGLNSKDVIAKYQTEQAQKSISNNASLKRITKQIKNYNENPHPFVAIFPCQNINIWKVVLLGPKQTPYENGLFILYVNFSVSYPFKAPEMRFITPIYHCNMNQQGRICHSIFDRNYSPATTFRQIVDCVYGLILTPEPDDPLDNVIASFYLSEYQKYYQNAKEATKKNASKTAQNLVGEIFGTIPDDIERQQKTKEMEQWIEKAKSFN